MLEALGLCQLLRTQPHPRGPYGDLHVPKAPKGLSHPEPCSTLSGGRAASFTTHPSHRLLRGANSWKTMLRGNANFSRGLSCCHPPVWLCPAPAHPGSASLAVGHQPSRAAPGGLSPLLPKVSSELGGKLKSRALAARLPAAQSDWQRPF